MMVKENYGDKLMNRKKDDPRSAKPEAPPLRASRLGRTGPQSSDWEQLIPNSRFQSSIQRPQISAPATKLPDCLEWVYPNCGKISSILDV